MFIIQCKVAVYIRVRGMGILGGRKVKGLKSRKEKNVYSVWRSETSCRYRQEKRCGGVYE